MSTDQYINNLFDTARNAQPLLTEDDIALQLQVKGNYTPKKFKFFNLKTLLLMSTLIILLAGLFYWMPDKTNEPDKIEPTKISSQPKKEMNKDEITLVDIPKAKIAIISKPIKVKDLSIVNQPEVSEQRTSFPLVNIRFDASVAPQKGELEYLMLSYEELLAFYIKTDGNVLEFDNAKDPLYLKNKSNDFAYNHYFVKIRNEGSTRTTSSIVDRKTSQDSLLFDVRPVMVDKTINGLTGKRATDHKVGETKTDYCDPFALKCIRESYDTWVRSNCVPIIIHLTAKESVYGGTSYDMIFWYKPVDSFIKLLPIVKQQWVRTKFPYDEVKQNEKLNELEKERTGLDNLVKIDSIEMNHLLQNILVLTNPELKRLGFIVDGKTANYSNTYQLKKYLHFKLSNINYVYISRSDKAGLFNGRKYAKLKFYPLFASDLEFKNIQLFAEDKDIPEELKVYNKDDIPRHYFHLRRNELVPVQVYLPNAQPKSITEIFWFEPTTEFLDALPKDKKPAESNNRNIDLKNIKVIELTTDEVKKLGITIQDKTIYLYRGGKPTPGVKGKPFYLGYNKAGSSITFNIKKMESSNSSDLHVISKNQIKMQFASDSFSTMDYSGFDSAPDSVTDYPAFDLITDDYGQEWRTYHIDDQWTEEEWKYVRKNHIDYKTWDTYINRVKDGEAKLISKIGGYIPILVKSGDVNLPDDK